MLTDTGKAYLQHRADHYRKVASFLEAAGVLLAAAGAYGALVVLEAITGNDINAQRAIAIAGVLAGTVAPGLILFGIGRAVRAVADWFTATSYGRDT